MADEAELLDLETKQLTSLWITRVGRAKFRLARAQHGLEYDDYSSLFDAANSEESEISAVLSSSLQAANPNDSAEVATYWAIPADPQVIQAFRNNKAGFNVDDLRRLTKRIDLLVEAFRSPSDPNWLRQWVAERGLRVWPSTLFSDYLD